MDEKIGRLQDVAQERLQRAGECQAQNQASYGSGAGLTSAGCVDSSDSMVRFWLEKKRDQHRVDADSIQALLDMLPAKIPPGAASALQRLLFK